MILWSVRVPELRLLVMVQATFSPAPIAIDQLPTPVLRGWPAMAPTQVAVMAYELRLVAPTGVS